MNFNSSFEKESCLAIKPREGTPRYTNFGSPAEPAAGETGQTSPSRKGRKPDANRTIPDGTEAEICAVYARDDPRYVGGNKTDLHNKQTHLVISSWTPSRPAPAFSTAANRWQIKSA